MRPTHLRSIIGALVVSIAVTPRVGRGQSDSVALNFIARAREAAARFHDLRAARAAGYTPIGPEVPAMGRHWVRASVLIDDSIEPRAPAILEYATIGGEEVLVGLGYARLLGPGESVPDEPVAQRYWHAHTGDVDEEALTDSHAGSGDSQEDRVAVLHVWTPGDNPAGLFVAENWSLPFLRAGLRAPRDAPPASAKAMALASGGASYFVAQFRLHGTRDERRTSTAETVYLAFADTVKTWLDSRGQTATLDGRDVGWLAALWERLERRIAELGSRRALPMDSAAHH